MANIEFVQGQETHSSRWGKYYVKGLETWECRESSDHSNHDSYTENTCLNVPENTVFTIFEQSGDKRGTEVFEFRICVATDAEVGEDIANYGRGRITGNFKVLAHGSGKIRAPRLMDWWISQRPEGVDPIAFALHCEAWIDKRGVKQCPPMPEVTTEKIEAKTEAKTEIKADPAIEQLRAELEGLKQRIRDAETLEDLKDLQMLVGAPEAEQKAAEDRIKKLDELDARCSWEKYESQCNDSERAARQQWNVLIDEQKRFESKYC